MKLGLLIPALTAMVATAGGSGVPVRATAADEIDPVGGGAFVAWSESRDGGRRFDVFAREGAGRPFRVNVAGTNADAGGISGTTLAFEQQRDIQFYDLVRRKRFAPPRGVNTTAQETRPSLSGRWLLFTRFERGRRLERVFARDLASGRQLELARAFRPPTWGPYPPGEWYLVRSGQVSGRYAVMNVCGGVCSVVLVDLDTERQVVIPAGEASASFDFSPSVTSNGTVYFVRNGSYGACDSDDVLMRKPLDGPAEVVVDVPAGIGIGSTYAVDDGGATTIYFSRGICSDDTDAYAVVDDG
jgi:diadenosine tetraphosphatase ApaH/serine/threonine PP2A family protein phosphatase